jgi:hypothetical protein
VVTIPLKVGPCTLHPFRCLNGAFTGDPSPFSIEQWPVYYPEARAALQRLICTHRVIPIPAFDIHGDIIHPTKYRAMLQGAIVAVFFALTHNHIPPRNGTPACSAFSPDILHIRVLVPPHHLPQSPVRTPRRKFTMKDTLLGDITGPASTSV